MEGAGKSGGHDQVPKQEHCQEHEPAAGGQTGSHFQCKVSREDRGEGRDPRGLGGSGTGPDGARTGVEGRGSEQSSGVTRKHRAPLCVVGGGWWGDMTQGSQGGGKEPDEMGEGRVCVHTCLLLLSKNFSILFHRSLPFHSIILPSYSILFHSISFLYVTTTK